MKKCILLAAAAIVALSSCSKSDIDDNMSSQGVMEFTATIEGTPETRTVYDISSSYAKWVAGDQIFIKGYKTDKSGIYTANATGATTTFTGPEIKDENTYRAYYPATMYDDGIVKLPAYYDYEKGRFNMPMYAASSTTQLQFQNLTAVLALTIKSSEVATVQSIKVTSAESKISGPCSLSLSGTDYKYHVTMTGTSDDDNVVILNCGDPAVTTIADGTVFYIPLPEGSHKLDITVTDGNGVTYEMAGKNAHTFVRSSFYTLTFKSATGTAKANINGTMKDVQWVRLWPEGPKFAVMNYGANTVTDHGDYNTWDSLCNGQPWGSNWRTPTKDEMEALSAAASSTDTKLSCTYITYPGTTDVYGYLYESKLSDYTDVSLFLPVQVGDKYNAFYWSSSTERYYMDLYKGPNCGKWYTPGNEDYDPIYAHVRPVVN